MSEVVLYYASVSGTAKTKKDTQSLRWLLEKKGVAFEEVDVARNPVALGTIRQKSGKNTIPQLFVDGKYIGGYEECQELEEMGKLDKALDP